MVRTKDPLSGLLVSPTVGESEGCEAAEHTDGNRDRR